MGVGRFVHHFGTFLLLAATVLLIIVDISAPVVNDISLLKVNLAASRKGDQVTFGTFGYCIHDVDGSNDECTKSMIGYNPAKVMKSLEGTSFGEISENTPKGLTRVMVLHPVATGLTFIAFLLCLTSGTVGSLMASIVAALAFIVILVALICDFVGLGIIKRKVDRDASTSHATWGVAIWLLLASAAATLAATVIVFFTCCASRARRRRESSKMETFSQQQSPPVTQKRHFWQRKNRY
ncbi:hypothetical protein G7046_g659 [Stylonectria norvegica]|nr:hypothetical protein G7046_g659 [Stylonectria norvegica]